MSEPGSTIAQQIAKAAIEFEHQRTGHAPRSAVVVMGGDTLAITLHGVLSPAEEALLKTPTGAARLQELHRELFAAGYARLRSEITRITGVDVRDATSEIDTGAGAVVKVFAPGVVVQVFLLAEPVATESWAEGDRPAL